MGFMNKFKGFMGIPEDEYEDDEDLDYDRDFEDPEEEDEDVTSFGTGSVRRPAPSVSVPSVSSFTLPDPEPAPQNKVVSIHGSSQYQVVVVKPERFEDASGIADHLIAKRAVLLNLEAVTPDLKRRLVDFLSGVAYTNGGQIKPVANSTYIITPCNVNVMGETMIDELGSHGIHF
ncbi:MAG: cell division protein SepF [Angelakisella sp.]|mgnify:CR=1 FL=1|nr:cell division protein SepF [Angelakisella sp.]